MIETKKYQAVAVDFLYTGDKDDPLSIGKYFRNKILPKVAKSRKKVSALVYHEVREFEGKFHLIVILYSETPQDIINLMGERLGNKGKYLAQEPYTPDCFSFGELFGGTVDRVNFTGDMLCDFLSCWPEDFARKWKFSERVNSFFGGLSGRSGYTLMRRRRRAY